MIDIETEQVKTLTEAANLIPRRRQGKRCHRATIFRWTRDGLKGVKLESIPIGGTRCTSVEAIKRFFARLAELDSGDSAAAVPAATKSPKPTAARKKSVEAARRRLARA
ncbi:MAG: DUF1580 domain-containing protein [Thermoguttaceae bacterium]|jgi:hypothetical protein|nr:DUF1580 domain-containing protein [Thermoguttaceae bacterium]